MLLPASGTRMEPATILAPSDRLLSATAVDLYLSYRSDKGSFTATTIRTSPECI